MKAPHYVVRNHNGIYYFRCRITSRLKRYFPVNKKEIRKSLKTRQWNEAIKKARYMWVVMNNFIDDIDSLDESIDDLERGVQLLIELDKLNDQSQSAYDSTNLDERILQLTENDKLLMENAWNAFKEINSKSSLDQDQDKLNKILHHLESLSIRQQVSSVGEHRLSDLIVDYMNDKGSIRDSSIRAYRSHLTDFMEISELETLDQISADRLRLYKKRFTQLPPNRKKNPKYKHLSVMQILDLNVEIKVSRDTCKAAFSAVSSFLIWLKNQQYLSESYKSILKLDGKKKKSDVNRSVFSNDDLEAIFSVEDYRSHGFRSYPFRYWVPLIGLYSGMRLNEICQLHVNDIQKVENIWVFNVNDEGVKQLKTSTSRRLIPIHSQLVKLGILEYVKSRNNEKMLFGQLKVDRDGKFYRSASRFFNESYKGKKGLLDWSGIERKTSLGRKDFHSFRHTFINCAKQSNVNIGVIKELVGHTTSDVTLETYGKNYSLAVKKKAINKIVFEFQHPEKWRK